MNFKILAIIFVLFISNIFAQKMGIEKIDSLLKELPKAQVDTNKVNIYDALTMSYYAVEPDKGIEFGKKGLELAKKLNWKFGIASISNSLGICYGSKSDYVNALEYFFNSLKVNEELKNRKKIGRNYGNIGIIYKEQGNITKALEYQFKALKLNQELGDKVGIALNYGNIANLYDIKLDYENALEYHFKALKINEDLGDKRGIALNNGNIAIIYSKLSNFSKALNFYFNALKFQESIGDKNGISRNYANIGKIYITLADDSVFKQLKEKNKFVESTSIGNLKKGIEYLQKAEKISTEIGYLGIMINLYNDLYACYKVLGNYKQALYYHELHEKVQDSVFNVEKLQKFSNIEADREKMLKEKELQILSKEKEKQTIIKNYLIVFSVLGIIFSFVIFYFYLRKNKDNKALEEKNIQINNAKILLEQLINHLPAHIYLKDENLKYLLVNNSFAEVLQLPIEEIIGRTDAELNQPEIYEQIDKELLLTKKPIYDFEYKHTNKEKEIFWTSTIKVLYDDVNGNTLGIIGIVLDITKRKFAEQALKESEEKFNSIVTNANEGIFIVQKGVFKFVNRHGASLLGLTTDDILEKEFSSFIHPDDRERIINIYKDKLVSREEITTYSYRYYNSNNELRWAEVSSIIHLWDKKPAILAFISDITERMIKEEEILKLNEDLRISNETIEAALYQKSALLEELSISEAKLIASVAAKDKFFSIISHDLKNPISALILGSELLFNYYEKFSDAEIKQKIKQLSESSKFLFKLLENLLHWSRSQTGALQYSPKNDNIVNIINSSFELLKLNAQTKNIELIKNTPEILNCYFDEDMITTVIRNLISNALKFTPESGYVEVGAIIKPSEDYKTMSDLKPSEGLEPSEGYLHIYIKDSGVGMDKETIDKLFRIDVNVTSKGTCGEKGTGLGLILCKEFVEKHGGKIWVESEVGKGSTFWFSLPI